MKPHRNGILTLSSGETLCLSDFRSHIEIVEVPWGFTMECDQGLRRDELALITSILVVPTLTEVVAINYGDLRFVYNDRTRLSAPVSSLMNRYHGLTSLAQLKARFRALIDPGAGFDDWLSDHVFAGPLEEPVFMRENLRYVFIHKPPDSAPASTPKTIQVEIQALVNSFDNSPFRLKVTS